MRPTDVTGFKFFCFPLAACATQKRTSHASAKCNNFRILGKACWENTRKKQFVPVEQVAEKTTNSLLTWESDGLQNKLIE